MKGRFDVVISGCGLAGAALAKLVARRGASVLVVERRALGGDKVCGEFLATEGCAVLGRLGLLDALRSHGAPRVTDFRITDLTGRCLDGILPPVGGGSQGLGISRAVLDAMVAESARSAGAIVLERHETAAPELRDGRVTGIYLRERGRASAPRRIEAALFVAADGRRSVLARRLHPELCKPPLAGDRAWFGLKTHLAGDPDRLRGRVELHLFDGGYAGLVGVEGQRLNLCALVRVRALRGCGGRPERLLRERILANPAARESIGDPRTLGRFEAIGPLRWGPRKPAAGGVLFVGDAAGTIDPFSGHGMSHALRSAELALPWVMEALERGALEDDLARGFSETWRRNFDDGRRRRVRRLGLLFERPRLAGVAVRLLRGPASAWVPRLAASTR